MVAVDEVDASASLELYTCRADREVSSSRNYYRYISYLAEI